VYELITIAGGTDIFAELSHHKSATEPIVSRDELVRRNPDVVIASWCGKKYSADKFRARPGFDAITAVQSGALHEIKLPLILRPDPAALTDGLAALEAIIAAA